MEEHLRIQFYAEMGDHEAPILLETTIIFIYFRWKTHKLILQRTGQPEKFIIFLKPCIKMGEKIELQTV